MRIVLVGFIIVLLALSCGLAVRYNQEAAAARGALDGERYKRMVAEENLLQTNKQLTSLTAEMKRVQARVESTEEILERTKAINKDLMGRLDRAAKIQTSLNNKVTELQQLMGSK